MSRIGRLPVIIPAGVEVKVDNNNLVTVKGPLGELSQAVDKKIKIKIENNQIEFSRESENKQVKAKHGLYRKLVFNMVEGVQKLYEKILVLNGVGYKASLDGNTLVLNVGYSHPIKFEQPEGLTIALLSPTQIKVSGIDKTKVGQLAANIKKVRIPDPYHAYGIRYSDEIIARKEGKKAGK